MEMEEESDPEIKLVDISVFTPHIRKHVELILLQPSIGLCHREVEVMNPRPSFPSYDENETNCDRFLMIIPYAGTPFECMVIFQSSGPECPPDFVFADSQFFLPIDEMESLSTWDVRQPDCLLRTMKEVLQFYKKRQIQELEKYEHLSFEYLCLFQLQNFHEDDIEILVPSDPECPVIFLIRLHVEFSCYFPDFYEDGSDTEENPLLFVTFPNRDSNRSHQRLYLSKNIETLLGIDESFQLPIDITDHYLTRYIVALEEDLKTKAELAASRKRKTGLHECRPKIKRRCRS